MISLLAGVAFSPSAANFFRPLDYAGSQANLDTATLYFSRLVLGVQLVLAGVQLPSRYLKQQWRPLAWLLGPVMTTMWLSTSLLIWAVLSPGTSFLHALVIGSCVTPTDPILSNVIVKGRFADQNVPPALQRIIIAESGANDGLGYPFLFLALYLIQYTGFQGTAEFPVPDGGAGKAMALWFGETWGYTIILSIIYGAIVGYIAKELLHWAEERKFVDRESFLVFAISLALFIVGTCGLIGSDDVLACFIAGNVFTWDDWFRLETKDDSLQPTIDMLLNVTIFMWYGAVCPWSMFIHGPVPIYRLIPLGIILLLLRRLPWVMLIHKRIPQIEDWRQGVFVGFFGPIGVSAIFYMYITVEFLDRLSPHSADSANIVLRPDIAILGETVTVVVWFLCVVSVVVHGLSIPLGKLGLYLPRTLSRVLPSVSTTSVDASDVDLPGRRSRHAATLPSFRIGSRVTSLSFSRAGAGESDTDRATSSVAAVGIDEDNKNGAVPPTAPSPNPHNASLPAVNTDQRPIYRIGGTIIPSSSPNQGSFKTVSGSPSQSPSPPNDPSSTSPLPGRTIRFPDDPPVV